MHARWWFLAFTLNAELYLRITSPPRTQVEFENTFKSNIACIQPFKEPHYRIQPSKKKIVPESRCTGKAGNAGQWAGRAWSAFVLLALFSAPVTVLQRWLCLLQPSFSYVSSCWHNMKDFWGLSWKLWFLRSCTEIHFDNIYCICWFWTFYQQLLNWSRLNFKGSNTNDVFTKFRDMW